MRGRRPARPLVASCRWATPQPSRSKVAVLPAQSPLAPGPDALEAVVATLQQPTLSPPTFSCSRSELRSAAAAALSTASSRSSVASSRPWRDEAHTRGGCVLCCCQGQAQAAPSQLTTRTCGTQSNM
jgi:hypothetical protein